MVLTAQSKDKTDKYQAFGVNKDDFEKSKDINKTFDLGKYKEKSKIYLTILDEMPLMVEHHAKFSNKELGIKSGDLIKTGILNILVHKVERPNEPIIDFEQKFSIWLSSKTLSIGLLRIYEKNNTLKNKNIFITVSKAIYKDFGENTCYDVDEYWILKKFFIFLFFSQSPFFTKKKRIAVLSG